VRAKAFPMIFLVFFALLVTISFVVGLSNNEIAEKVDSSSVSCDVVKADDGKYELLGESIDTPVMPG